MEAKVFARRRALGLTEADDLKRRNQGRRRTSSKRALLAVLERNAKERGLPRW
jgi:hypothetical protein